MKIYDMIVLGGGPAGYTAAMYAVRAGLSALVIEKVAAGGQMTETAAIDNYPGFEDGVDGYTLGGKMKAQAEKFGAESVNAEVREVFLMDKVKRIVTEDSEYLSKTVVAATGAHHRKLGLRHEEELIGRGVGYCAECDGMFYKGKNVAVVGGGNSAAADALALSRIANSVTLIHRRDSLRASKVYHEPLINAENVHLLLSSEATEFVFEDKLTGVYVKDKITGEERMLPLDGLFISIGRSPETDMFKGQLALDDNGYLQAGEDTRTSVPGVFAAGDVRTKALRQIITAAADGASAAHFAEEYLADAGGF